MLSQRTQNKQNRHERPSVLQAGVCVKWHKVMLPKAGGKRQSKKQERKREERMPAVCVRCIVIRASLRSRTEKDRKKASSPASKCCQNAKLPVPHLPPPSAPHRRLPPPPSPACRRRRPCPSNAHLLLPFWEGREGRRESER